MCSTWFSKRCKSQKLLFHFVSCAPLKHYVACCFFLQRTYRSSLFIDNFFSPSGKKLKASHCLPKSRLRTPSSRHSSNGFARQRLHHIHNLWRAPLPQELKKFDPTTPTIVGSRSHNHAGTIVGQVPVDTLTKNIPYFRPLVFTCKAKHLLIFCVPRQIDRYQVNIHPKSSSLYIWF